MSETPEPSQNTILCPQCRQTNAENNYKCTRCGCVLHGAPPPVAGSTSTYNALGVLIPYKNSQALAAYYCGVFGLIPCLGLPVAVAAVVLGILGLKFAKQHPETKGKAHAWAGIILGGLVLIGTVVVILMIGAAAKRR
jgi:hypothetical protein